MALNAMAHLSPSGEGAYDHKTTYPSQKFKAKGQVFDTVVRHSLGCLHLKLSA